MHAYTRKEIARTLGVDYANFRYWLKVGKAAPPDMACGKERLYSEQQAKRVYQWYASKSEELAKTAAATAERLRKLCS